MPPNKIPAMEFRKQAAQNGLTTYFTGQACKNGHLSERFTADGTCKDCKKRNYALKKQRDRLKR